MRTKPPAGGFFIVFCAVFNGFLEKSLFLLSATEICSFFICQFCYLFFLISFFLDRKRQLLDYLLVSMSYIFILP
ncbi:hypothetical protein DNO_0085 [Dichelobacter nodosus VCS1703A]|uniref:Uncharacterized protein n=1 Tax=Dichelobacter nodosus (strain VCS1703A) TaxID=246195 RepID=A5EWT2_DICNV|nr:hypothetical protein DNO_0085 [Dichelobacter nodosus VCS1703A]AXM45017.1 hypothetical protein DYQ38_00400 [Dichelobacter nodosus]KNZ39706.1 hypothetical protein AKG33_02510 [Dichelobacter nodosus]